MACKWVKNPSKGRSENEINFVLNTCTLSKFNNYRVYTELSRYETDTNFADTRNGRWRTMRRIRNARHNGNLFVSSSSRLFFCLFGRPRTLRAPNERTRQLGEPARKRRHNSVCVRVNEDHNPLLSRVWWVMEEGESF